MQTTMLILKVDGTELSVTIDMDKKPTLTEIWAALKPYLDGAAPEHINVKVDSGYTDMFVDDDGLGKRLPRNEKATAIYRRNWLEKYPQTNPERMPYIAGPAVVFSRRVWF